MSVLTRAKTAQKPYDLDNIVDLSGLNIFENIGKSNFIISPNYLYDLISLLPLSEQAVINYTFKNIYGYGKRNYAWVSNKAILIGTGLCKTTIIKCLKNLKARGLILVQIVKSEGIQKQIIFLNCDSSRKTLNDLRENKITVNELLGIKEKPQNLLQKIVSKAKSFIVDSNDSVGTFAVPERGTFAVPNKEQILNKTNTNKEQTTDKENIPLNKTENLNLPKKENDVVVSYGILNTEEEENKEAIKLLSEATYKKVNIDFNQKIAQTLIKKNKMINNRDILEVIKEKIEYLQFEKIDTDRHSPNQVLYQMIIQDRKPTKAYNESKIQVTKDSESEYYKTLLSCVGQFPNNTNEENAKMIIRMKICDSLNRINDYNNDSDKKTVTTQIINLVLTANKPLEELMIFSKDRVKEIRKAINHQIDKKYVEIDDKTLNLINFELEIKSFFGKMNNSISSEVKKISGIVNSLGNSFNLNQGIPI